MILFLDFDGVMHPLSRKKGLLSQESTLADLLRNYPHIQVVITSAWRTEHSIEILKGLFQTDLRDRIIDVTPDLTDDPQYCDGLHLRQKEIECWLREAGREYEPWVALDDSEGLFSPTCKRLLLVDPSTGFDQNAAEALKMRLG